MVNCYAYFFNMIIAIGTIHDLRNKKAIEYSEITKLNGETKIIKNNEINFVSNGK